MAGSSKPLVLVLGATGFTGQSVVDGLLKSGEFRVAALIRPASVSKPQTETLRASGVEIRLGDITDAPATLRETLAGVDILISAVSAWIIDDQKEIFRAAKDVGVKRVVPCDWATPGAKGLRELHDKKLAIREFVQDLGVPYTFLDVGWWMQISLPLPARSATHMKAKTYQVFGDGANRLLVTDLRHIGAHVARVVADPRTLGHAVMIWEDEPTQLETHEIGERYSGEGESIKAQRQYVKADEVLQWVAEGKAELARGVDTPDVLLKVHWNMYMYSMHILGENTLENAKRLGYLDVRELYPDVPRYTLEDFAKEFYTWENPGKVFDRHG
ncbi:NAD-P-binding protein [Trametes versicolor FP-101664 SS1]|uniref:NAD-P-binding protein n=1 Tax=Trametes versicolor (strain FP-101664) TaxID=717944 RepID=UPI0004621EB5|nr:NAD-P-binding protein [Trametes versicolor FP-101664 SS1]EIW53911.1 NAD-P-binding protein [Trametes versicolor FP-101664 SS1]